MTEFEQKLFIAVAKKIKNDNVSLHALSDKVMAEVRAYCDKHKKEYKALTDFEKERLTNVRYVLGEISKIKYTREQLDSAIENNLKRIPGNLADESRREDLYNVLANLNFKCIYSDTLLVGGGQKIHLDHIIPVNLGGPTDDWNILPICGSCNSSKSDSHLLDWWEKEHTPQDEHKLVYIFEYMANRLLKSLNTKGVKVVTTLTDDEIRKAIELENKERQQEESKQQTIDLEEEYDIEDDYEDIEEVKDQKIKRLDAITFLYQMLNHIKQNRQCIISPDNLNQGVLDTLSDKDKQRLIDKKFKKLEKLFNSIYKQNKRLTGVKTDIQLLDEQRKMVEYIKSLDIVSYYHISYTYFDELQQMLDQGKTDKEIQEFCYDHDRGFNFVKFYNELMEYKETFKDLKVKQNYTNQRTGYNLGSMICMVRVAKNKLFKGEELGDYKTYILTEEQYKILDDLGFIWDARSFDWDTFYYELIRYKREKGSFKGITEYVNKETGYKLGEKVCHIKDGKKIKDIWDTLTLEEQEKAKKQKGIQLEQWQYDELDKIGFVWDARIFFDFDKFYNELLEYKKEHPNFEGVTAYINPLTGYHLGQKVGDIKKGKKAIDEWNALSEEEKLKTDKPGANVLTRKQYDMLDNIGFVWDAKPKFDFDKFYKELLEYKKEHPKFQGITNYTNPLTGYELGVAVSGVRVGKKAIDEWNALSEEEKLKTNKPGTYVLTKKQYDILDNIGFPWKVPKEDRYVDWFTPFYEKLKLFVLNEKRYPRRSEKRSIEEKRLSFKVNDIRSAYKKIQNDEEIDMRLTQEMIDKLDEIHFAWTAKEEKEKIALFLAEQGIEHGLSA